MSTEGPEPARGSLDGVIHRITDEISSTLEEIHDQYCALGAQESLEAQALENVNNYPFLLYPLLAVLQLADGRGMIREHKYWREKSSRAWILLRYSLALKNSRREKEKNPLQRHFSWAPKRDLSRNRQHEARRPEANRGAQLQQIPKPG